MRILPDACYSYFEPRYLWVGMRWDDSLGMLVLYLCPLPMWVILFRWNRLV